MNEIKLYIAGKVSKNSSFGTHHWRDKFCDQLQLLSGLKLSHLDPLATNIRQDDYKALFSHCVQSIKKSDCVVVYLSDDISVGGAQEIMIARYLKKPVIGFAPYGGKFNGAVREMMGKTIENFKDPFVFSTCDVVCGTMDEVADALASLDNVTSTGMSIIDV